MLDLSVQEAGRRFPGSLDLIRTLYTDGRIDGEAAGEALVFVVSNPEDWWPLPGGTLVYPSTGYTGIAWWEEGRWLYSDFGTYWYAGKNDHGVYVFLPEGRIGERIR